MSGLFDLDKLAKQAKNGPDAEYLMNADSADGSGRLDGSRLEGLGRLDGSKKKYIRKSYIKKDEIKGAGKKANKSYSFEDLHKKYLEITPENYGKLEVKDYIRWINKDGTISDGFTISSIDDKKFKIKNKTGDFTFDPSLFNKVYKFNKVVNIRNTGIITPDGVIPFEEAGQAGQAGHFGHTAQVGHMETPPKDDVLSQIGNKLLFDDSHVIKLDIENINVKIKKMELDIKNMFIFLKKVHSKLEL
jgi:hypothetical protein